uniref:Uncharacterized protein n=1 Tax=Xiphophorus couchianus TaxID=32473 RepID=A0A3B5M9G0_9TELE
MVFNSLLMCLKYHSFSALWCTNYAVTDAELFIFVLANLFLSVLCVFLYYTKKNLFLVSLFHNTVLCNSYFVKLKINSTDNFLAEKDKKKQLTRLDEGIYQLSVSETKCMQKEDGSRADCIEVTVAARACSLFLLR